MRYIIKGGVWKNSEDEILKAAVMKYGLNQWSRISSLLVRKSAKQCKQRWYEWLDPSIKKTEWTREEEEKLLHLAKIFPSQWRTIAPIVGRTPMQCVEKYEKLLDQAQGKDQSDPNDPRRLRPGEIDPNPETKPARPDPIDMDEDEKEMLAEARVRLANTKGKKAKRKARGKLIEEARRLAFLQKKRELKAAGLEYVNHRVEKPFIIRKLNLQLQGIDYNREIAFERMVPEFVFKTGPEEDPEPDKKLSNVSLQQMEGRRRDEEEEARRKIDQRRMKKLKEREMDQAVNLYNKTTNLLNLKKTRMMLPDPQLKDQDLELLGKLNAVNDVSEHANTATRALVGNYSQRESSMLSVMRTPRAPNTVMREAQNIIALQQTETPLMGGENPILQITTTPTGGMRLEPSQVATPNQLAQMLRTPSGAVSASRVTGSPSKFSIRGSSRGGPGFLSESIPSQTPLHDALRLHPDDFDRSWDDQSNNQEPLVDLDRLSKLRAVQTRQQILSGLKNLPQPKNEFQVMMPNLQDNVEVEGQLAMDAEDNEKLTLKDKLQAERKALKQRTQAQQKNLPPPKFLPKSLYNLSTGDHIRDQLENMLQNHVLQLIKEDQTSQGFILGNIVGASKLLSQEGLNLRGTLNQNTQDIWDKIRQSYFFDQEKNDFVNIEESENRIQILKSKYLKKSLTLSKIEKKNQQLQSKLGVLLRGYQIRMKNTDAELQNLNQEIIQCVQQTSIYQQALNHERQVYRNRIDEMAKYHDLLLVKQNDLQKLHEELIKQREEIDEEPGIFCNNEELKA